MPYPAIPMIPAAPAAYPVPVPVPQYPITYGHPQFAPPIHPQVNPYQYQQIAYQMQQNNQPNYPNYDVPGTEFPDEGGVEMSETTSSTSGDEETQSQRPFQWKDMHGVQGCFAFGAINVCFSFLAD